METDSVANEESSRVWRTGLFVVLLLFLNLQMDGFHLAADPTTNQWLLLPFTLFFCVLLTGLLGGGATLPLISSMSLAGRLSPRLLHGLAAVMLLPSAALFIVSARHYAAFGYVLHLPRVILVFGGAGLLFSLCFWCKRPAPYVLGAALVSYSAVLLLSVWSFPLRIERSDMLPLLSAANARMLEGASPYGRYTFSTESVSLTYLPGTLLAYLPSTVLHADPRLVNLVCVVLLVVLLYQASAAAHRYRVAALLAVWLVSPYLLYRHELYTEPHWLAVVASLLLLQRGRLMLSAVVFGISVSLSQFSWVIVPFYLLYLVERFGWKRGLQAAVLLLTTAAAIILPFLRWSPESFIVGVFSFPRQTQAVAAHPVNLSFWLAKLVGAPNLQRVQAVLLLGWLLVCATTRSCRSLAGMLRAMCLALAGFILCNILIWGYFFLLLELFLLLYLFAANGWLGGEEQSKSADGDVIAPSFWQRTTASLRD